MVETHLMLPREKEIELLMNHVEAGNCTFIFGLPSIGKTVLAYHLLEKLKPKDQVLAMYIDLNDFAGDATNDVLNSIILKIGEAIPGGSDQPIPTKGDRKHHLKKLLRNLSGKKTVILLDSAEGIKKLSDWEILLHTIRALHVESRMIFFLFSRIRPQGFSKGQISSPAINIFEANLIKLNLLSKEVVNSLSQYLTDSGIDWEPVFPGFILQHTGGHPLLVKTYMDIYRTEKKKYLFLDDSDFNGIEEKAERKLRDFYKEIFGIISPVHREIIKNDVLESKISQNRDKFLRDLFEWGIIRKLDGGYQLFSIGAKKYFQKNFFSKKTGGKRYAATNETHQEPLNLIKKILILAANPQDTSRLRLDEEVREIDEGLRRSKHRNRFEIHTRLAVRLRDLRRALLDVEPHIVHFTGHGKEDGILVEDELGMAVGISAQALKGLFKLCSNHVECVILTACYSGKQAGAISKHINYVIGMKKEIEDRAAIEFAVGFYDALGAGKPVEQAFEFGRNAILQLFPNQTEYLMPILKKRIPETHV